jgi:amino acid permease
MSDSSISIIHPQSRFSNFDQMSPLTKSIYIRTFGKMEPGALRGAIFNLISTCLGAGCLALPLILHIQGIILGLALVLLTSYISYLGIINLSEAAENFQIYDYSNLIHKVLGPNWKILYNSVLVIAMMGTIIGYQIIIGDFVPGILGTFNIGFDPYVVRCIVMIAANVLIITPLGLIRKLTSLRFMSLVSCIVVVFIVLLVMFQFPYYAKQNEYENNTNWFNLNLSILSSFNVCFYSFSCHNNVTQVYDELNNKNLRRMNKVAFRSLFIILIAYVFLAIFGYLSTLESTPSLFIIRQPPKSISSDWLMVTARILMLLTLIIASAINIPCARRIIIKFWLGITEEPSVLV